MTKTLTYNAKPQLPERKSLSMKVVIVAIFLSTLLCSQLRAASSVTTAAVVNERSPLQVARSSEETDSQTEQQEIPAAELSSFSSSMTSEALPSKSLQAEAPWHSIAPVFDDTEIPIWIQRYIEFHNAAIALPRNITTDTNHYLIYTCRRTGKSKSIGCSGTGNRHRIILAMFLVAVLTDRIFLIDIDHPVPLYEILRPHLIDWNAIPPYIDELPSEFRNILNQRPIFELNTPEDFTIEAKPQVVRVLANSPAHLLNIWKSPLVKQCLAKVGLVSEEAVQYPQSLKRSIFVTLFQPTSALKNTVQEQFQVLKLVGVDGILQPYSAIHVRAGGDWPGRDEARYKLTELKPFYDRANRLSPDSPMVVVSDNAAAKRVLVETYPSRVRIVSNVSLMHVDRSINDQVTAQGSINVWADLVILAQSKCIIGSTGSFSKLAYDISQPLEASNTTRCYALVVPRQCDDPAYQKTHKPTCLIV